MESDFAKNQKIEEIRKKMKEKRKQRAHAEINGSWNKSFGKKIRCPNASVILKQSLKSNNRALAKTLQSLKQENRQAQDMLTYMQAEQQLLTQTIYRMKQNEKQNEKRRKDIQAALNDVTTSLLNAGSKLAYAMELNTSFPTRESHVSRGSSDDDSALQSSMIVQSIYHRKSESELLPAQPLEVESDCHSADSLSPVDPFIPPDPLHRDALPPADLFIDDPDCHGNDLSVDIDPAKECIDSKMMEDLDLDFDIPLMFTDDNLSDEDLKGAYPPKCQTKISRASGLLTETSSNVTKTSKRSSSTHAPSVNTPAANTRSRGTFVVAENITEDAESEKTEEHMLFTSPQPLNQTSGILNQTFEIDDENRPSSRGAESSVLPRKENGLKDTGAVFQQVVGNTTHAVDKELTGANNSKEVAAMNKNKDGSCKSGQADKGKQEVKSTKKKSKLPLKKAKTKVSLKRRDLQEVFQSPKSPLMSPNTPSGGNGLSFRCVPSPVFGKAPKRKHVISKPHHTNKMDISVTSVFDISDGDTFTEAKSILFSPNYAPKIDECVTPPQNVCKVKSSRTENQSRLHDQDKAAKADTVVERKRSSQTKSRRKNTSSDKRQSKSGDKSTSSLEDLPQDKTPRMPDIDEKNDAGNPPQVTTELKETKISRKSRKSKSVNATVGKKDNKVTERNDVDMTEACHGSNNKDSTLDGAEQDASLFFITKPKIHRASKKSIANKSSTSGSQSRKEEIPANSQQALSSVQTEEENKQPTEMSTQSTVTDDQSEPQLPSQTDLLEDVEMFGDNEDQVGDNEDQDQAVSGDCDQLRTKIRKSRKRSSIPVLRSKEWNAKSEENNEKDDELKDDAVNIVETSEELPARPVSSRRGSRVSTNERVSGSPVVRQKRNGRKRRLPVDTDDSDDGEEVIAATQKKRRSSASQGSKRQKRTSQKSTRESQESEVHGKGGLQNLKEVDENNDFVETSEEKTPAPLQRVIEVLKDDDDDSPVIKKTKKGRKGRLQLESDESDVGDEAVLPTQTRRRSVSIGNNQRKRTSHKSTREAQGSDILGQRCLQELEEVDNKVELEASKDIHPVSSDRISEVVKDDRVSGSPVIRKTKKGRKGRLQVHSDESADEETDAPKQRRRSVSKGAKKSHKKDDISKIQDIIEEMLPMNVDNEETTRCKGTARRSKNANKKSKSKKQDRQAVEDVPEEDEKSNHKKSKSKTQDRHTVEDVQEEDEKSNHKKSKSKTQDRQAVEDVREEDEKSNHKKGSKEKMAKKKSTTTLQKDKVIDDEAEIQNKDCVITKSKPLPACIKKKCDNKNKQHTMVSFEDTQEAMTTDVHESEPPQNINLKMNAGEDKQQVDMAGRGSRPSRRATSTVSYREPSLGSKLRRGDPHTSKMYLTSADIYKNNEKKIIKKKMVETRKPLGDVENTIDSEAAVH